MGKPGAGSGYVCWVTHNAMSGVQVYTDGQNKGGVVTHQLASQNSPTAASTSCNQRYIQFVQQDAIHTDAAQRTPAPINIPAAK